MQTVFNFHNLVSVQLNGSKSTLRDYCALEFNHGIQTLDASTPPVTTLSINLVQSITQVNNPIFSIGKGIFYDYTEDTILISKDRDTSFFNIDDIYATIKNYCLIDTTNIIVSVSDSVMTSDTFESHLQDVYRRIVKLDPRDRHRRNAESFVSEILEPAINRLFTLTDHILLHSAALDKNGDGILILGPQNVGKTTTAIQLAKNGYKLLADDLCLINESGKLLSYLKPLKLERELLSSSKFARAAARQSNRASDPATTSFLMTLGRDTSGYEVKVPADSLGIETTRSSQLKRIFFLQRTSEPTRGKGAGLEEISSDVAAGLCVSHQIAEFDGNKRLDCDIRRHLALLSGYNRAVDAVDDKCLPILRSALDGVEAYVLTVHDPAEDPAHSISELVG